MSKLRCLAIAIGLLGLAQAAPAVTMDWTFVGDSGNACEVQGQLCFGAVGYDYYIGTYEVTNGQYAEFLNAKAASDPLGLYNTNMGVAPYGGIARTGGSGSYSYSAIAGREDMPVANVSFYDALRFANWMNNGQGGGDTETGAYMLVGGTPMPDNGLTVTRTTNQGATIFLPYQDEWYKAAYYNALTSSYFDYPAGSDTETTCAAPGGTPNTANCLHAGGGNLTIVGSYTGSPSPYDLRPGRQRLRMERLDPQGHDPRGRVQLPRHRPSRVVCRRPQPGRRGRRLWVSHRLGSGAQHGRVDGDRTDRSRAPAPDDLTLSLPGSSSRA